MKLISHRGLNDHNFKENSKIAILTTLKENYISGVEIDVRMTKDKRIIIYHDKTLILKNEKIDYISDLTLLDIKANYTSICELDELLKEINTNKEILIEIKCEDENYKEVVDKVYDIIKNYLYLNIKICSFNKKIISYFKKKYKKYEVGLIIGIKKNKYSSLNFYDFNSISKIHHNLLKKNDYAWTIDDIETFNMIKKKHKNISIITNKAYLFKDETD